jgi:hypothetical protein
MSDLISIGTLAATALSMAADSILKGLVGEAAKDSYKSLKSAVSRWTGNNIEALEKDPTSTARQAVIAEEIDRQSEREQEKVRALAAALIEALEKEGVSDLPTNVTVKATSGGVAAGRDIAGSTIATHSGSKG